MAVVARTMAHDTNDEIALLPQRLNASLIKALPKSQLERITQLGIANLYGWSAYAIYDDFLDNEGDPRDLSVANILSRHSLQNFKQALPNDISFHNTVDRTFDTIDSANDREVQHCRLSVTNKAVTIAQLPQYQKSLQLADRSLGHVLGPLGVLAAGGIAADDPRAVALCLALRHYLVARQLNDDLHDWEQDTRAGIATYVVAKILRNLSVPPGQHSFRTILPKMQQEFWHNTLPSVCKTIQMHTSRARKAANSSRLLRGSNLITILTTDIDTTVAVTLQEQTKAQDFLAAYTNQTPKVTAP
jgi:hypothetical protein